jgi:hypothetical protein
MDALLVRVYVSDDFGDLVADEDGRVCQVDPGGREYYCSSFGLESLVSDLVADGVPEADAGRLAGELRELWADARAELDAERESLSWRRYLD